MNKNIRNIGKKQLFEGSRYCVLFLSGGKERRSPWFRSEKYADRVFKLMSDLGYRSIVYVD